MMHHEKKYVLIGTQAQEQHTQQRATSQVERLTRLALEQLSHPVFSFLLRNLSQIHKGNNEAQEVHQDRLGLPFFIDKNRTQRFMAGNNFLQAALKRGEIQPPFQAISKRYIIRNVSWIKLIQEPDLLLRK